MCGIVGYIGRRQAPEIIYEGLKRLEYRGYDSAGIAVLGPDGNFAVRRDAGKLSNLGELLLAETPGGHGRHWPHTLGHPRRPHPTQLPSPYQHEWRRGFGPQRHRGELPGAAR